MHITRGFGGFLFACKSIEHRDLAGLPRLLRVVKLDTATQRNMQLYIFRGPDRVFGLTADGTGVNLLLQYAPWSAFKLVEMSRDGEPKPSVNSQECLDNIGKYGFHITDAHVRTTETVIAN
jgi:hypothetical protein